MKIEIDGAFLRLAEPRGQTLPKIPTGFYNIGMDNHGFHLMMRPQFTLPDKIYGKHDDFAERFLITADRLGHGISALLSGPKGCGKTLTAKMICMKADRPVICITDAWFGGGFNNFLECLPNSCVIFIDEFEKIYRDAQQRDAMLSLLDGTADKKHLFVLTSNSADVGQYFDNRPGRIRYHRKYEALGIDVLTEIIKDRVPAGKIRKGLIETVTNFGGINPDGLMCLISECLIHNQIPDDFLDYFNVFPELGSYYSVKVETAGYRPKPGLSKPRLRRAQEFLSYVTNYDLDYAMECEPLGFKDCEEIREVYNCDFSQPFARQFGKPNHNDWINVNYMRGPNKRERGFSLHERNIQKIDRHAGKITIKEKNGTVWELTPTSKTLAIS